MELLDREHERASLQELLDGARAGSGGALVLHGPFGIGLSALLADAVASAADMVVVRLAGARTEREQPFAGLQRLCAPVLDGLAQLPQPQRDALAAAFGLETGHEPAPFLVGQAASGLLAQAAAERPVLCAVDDAQWLDDASAEALAFVARRCAGAPVAVVVGEHRHWRGESPFGDLDGIAVEGLPREAARELVVAAAGGPLDACVLDRLVAEAAGFPLALVELPAQLTPEQLSGAASLPEVLAVGDRVEERLLPLFARVPDETRRLLLLAAAAAGADAATVWRAAEALGIDALAAAPAEESGLLRLGQRAVFRHPLLPHAVYEAASVAERRRVHQALADAADTGGDPDLRAVHRAAACLVPDEGAAGDLEAAAARAKARREHGSAATLLERAAALSPDPQRRYRRTLAAAQAALAAGALPRAASLLDAARPFPPGDLQRAQADRLRSAIGLARGQRADRATMLLRAALAFGSLDVRLARDTHLEALEVASYSAPLGGGAGLHEIAAAARTAPRADPEEEGAADLLLDGVAQLVTEGHAAAVPTLRRAIGSLGRADDLRWLALAVLVAFEVWDDEAVHHLTIQAERARRAGAVAALPLAFEQLPEIDDVLAGRFGDAPAPLSQLPGQPRERGLCGPGALLAAAWRGRSAEARELAETAMRDAFARDLGFHVAVAHHATAILEIGLGRYEPALTSAREACAATGVYVRTSALPDLVEAAVRSGEPEVAAEAVRDLAERTAPCESDWALGTLLRARALLAEGTEAESQYRESIEHLRRSRAAPQLARAHLVYGEWLRRERRRREAREQLRTARDMFIFMGARAFAERARTELKATGEHVSRRAAAPTSSLLTPQEARIAQLVGAGASNAEIGAQLFISPRTVEYHLHKVFRKLDVRSRTQLARALVESGASGEQPELVEP